MNLTLKIFLGILVVFIVPFSLVWCFNHFNPWIAFLIGIFVIAAIISYISIKLDQTNKNKEK